METESEKKNFIQIFLYRPLPFLQKKNKTRPNLYQLRKENLCHADLLIFFYQLLYHVICLFIHKPSNDDVGTCAERTLSIFILNELLISMMNASILIFQVFVKKSCLFMAHRTYRHFK